MQRKCIAVLTAYPEGIYCQRVFEGIFARCKQYGYDTAVFAQCANICDKFKDYLSGEKNIYELINYEQVDGVIILPLMFDEDGENVILAHVMDRIRRECKVPVVSMDMPMEGCGLSSTDDRGVIYEITRHIVEDHGCTNVLFLSGREGSPSSDNRIAGYLDYRRAAGMSADMSTIVYGDFWYPGGISLADRIADGEIEMPEAVICASDHMAIGLANRLVERGIRVPEQIIVTGFDATQEAMVNQISITTAVPAVDEAAARAVDQIRSIIEPDSRPEEYRSKLSERLVKCSSCGCCEDPALWRRQFKCTQYYSSYTYDSADFRKRSNITLLMESHMLEKLSGAYSPQDCIEEIYNSTYLIQPYSNFYLCLREDWLDTEAEYTVGYPKRMKTVVHTTPQQDTGFFDERGRMFDTALMLPELHSGENEPSAYFFSPVHFNEEMLGYTVLQCSYESRGDLNFLVYRNWLRNINSALEITRARNRLFSLSTHDGMTGLYNRLGMKHYLKRALRHAGADSMLLAYVVDMDGLKQINDTYGHSEGDYGIITIGKVLGSVVKEGEIAIRAGGDEFYILGVGSYSEAGERERAEKLSSLIELADMNSGKPYKISASIGYVIRPISGAEDIESIISEADSLMYRNKSSKSFRRRE